MWRVVFVFFFLHVNISNIYIFLVKVKIHVKNLTKMEQAKGQFSAPQVHITLEKTFLNYLCHQLYLYVCTDSQSSRS